MNHNDPFTSIVSFSDDRDWSFAYCITNGLNPRQLSDLFGDVIEELKSNKPILAEYGSHIQAVIIEEETDLLRLYQFTRKEFAAMMSDRVGEKKLKGILPKILKSIKKRLELVTWTNIINAVSHEMNDGIANDIKLLADTLGPLTHETAEKLPEEINQKTKRKLTVPEAQYLQGLLDRALGAVHHFVASDHKTSYCVTIIIS